MAPLSLPLLRSLLRILLLLFSILLALDASDTTTTTSRLRVNDSTWKPVENLRSFNGILTAITARGRQNLQLSSMFETGLYSILRLRSKPRRRTRKTVIPKLMMDLYLKRVAEHSRPAANQMRERVDDNQSEADDVIRSFFARGRSNS